MSDENAFWKVMADGAWKGQRAWVIGGGPSIKKFDFQILKGEKVITTNVAYLKAPFADIEVFMDFTTFYRWLMLGKYGPGSLKIWNDLKYKVHIDLSGRILPGCYRIPTRVRSGLARGIKSVYHGNNVGYAGLQVAVALKANPIYLLGFDFCHIGSKKDNTRETHFHNFYPERQPLDVIEGYMWQFRKLVPDLNRRGIQVFNCSKISKAVFFKYADPIQVLKGKKNGQTGENLGGNN